METKREGKSDKSESVLPVAESYGSRYRQSRLIQACRAIYRNSILASD
ncbi:MAG: hypothetical protein ACXWT3_01965 [Methylococcaceae bacterium]